MSDEGFVLVEGVLFCVAALAAAVAYESVLTLKEMGKTASDAGTALFHGANEAELESIRAFVNERDRSRLAHIQARSARLDPILLQARDTATLVQSIRQQSRSTIDRLPKAERVRVERALSSLDAAAVSLVAAPAPVSRQLEQQLVRHANVVRATAQAVSGLASTKASVASRSRSVTKIESGAIKAERLAAAYADQSTDAQAEFNRTAIGLHRLGIGAIAIGTAPEAVRRRAVKALGCDLPDVESRLQRAEHLAFDGDLKASSREVKSLVRKMERAHVEVTKAMVAANPASIQKALTTNDRPSIATIISDSGVRSMSTALLRGRPAEAVAPRKVKQAVASPHKPPFTGGQENRPDSEPTAAPRAAGTYGKNTRAHGVKNAEGETSNQA